MLFVVIISKSFIMLSLDTLDDSDVRLRSSKVKKEGNGIVSESDRLCLTLVGGGSQLMRADTRHGDGFPCRPLKSKFLCRMFSFECVEP
jgi:hypothetical protein